MKYLLLLNRAEDGLPEPGTPAAQARSFAAARSSSVNFPDASPLALVAVLRVPLVAVFCSVMMPSFPNAGRLRLTRRSPRQNRPGQ
jgi:hypothetical protein